MSRKSALWGLAVLALALGCVTAGWGRDENPTRKKVDVSTIGPGFALENHQLPYAGFGSVSILDDGFLLIQLGGEDKTDPETGEFMGITPQDVIGLQINAAQGWGLIQAGRELFLDRHNSAEMASRGLKGSQANRTSFRQGLVETDTVFVLHTLVGPMTFNYDAAAGRIRLTLDDTEKSGLRLGMDEDLGTAHGSVVAKSGSFQPAEPTDLTAEGPALLRIVIDPSPLALLLSAECSVGCSGGSCSVICNTGGCRAVCEGSTPECKCVR